MGLFDTVPQTYRAALARPPLARMIFYTDLTRHLCNEPLFTDEAQLATTDGQLQS